MTKVIRSRHIGEYRYGPSDPSGLMTERQEMVILQTEKRRNKKPLTSKGRKQFKLNGFTISVKDEGSVNKNYIEKLLDIPEDVRIEEINNTINEIITT